MKKSRIMVILSGLGLAVFMAVLIWSQYYPDVPAEQIAGELAKQPGIAEMRTEDASGLRRYYSIDSAETEGFLFFRSNSIMSADELLVVRAKDHEDGGGGNDKNRQCCLRSQGKVSDLRCIGQRV